MNEHDNVLRKWSVCKTVLLTFIFDKFYPDFHSCKELREIMRSAAKRSENRVSGFICKNNSV